MRLETKKSNDHEEMV